MVNLKTAIREINTGIVEFIYPLGSGCTTESEVVLLLEELEKLRKESNPWVPYPDVWPEKEGLYWVTYISKDIDKKEILRTTKILYNEALHAFMGFDKKVIAWKYDIPYEGE